MTDVLSIVSTNSGISRDGYGFDLNERRWQVSHDVKINHAWIDEFLHPCLHNSYLNVMKFYVQKYSAGHAEHVADSFRRFARYTNSKNGIVRSILSNDLINYYSSLETKHEHYLGVFRGFLKSWVELGYLGVDEDIPILLNGWRLRGNTKGLAVQTLCPVQGPLSDLEYEALQLALINAFELNEISLDDFLLTQLFMVTGRRPSQIGDLKVKDVIEASSDGLQSYLLKVPRRKQRGTNWRGQFKSFALTSEIGITLKVLIEKNKTKFSTLINSALLSESDLEQLPIFPNWRVIKQTLEEETLANVLSLLKGQGFHCITYEFRLRLNNVVTSLKIPSERTGQNLRIFPTRLRRTLATRAAREGYGELIIAELLDHSDTQNSRVYTENVPEHVDAINNAVALQLAPLAQAFSGMLVDRESDANRGDDLSSRVKSDKGNIGTCGLHGFCGAAAPVACYTCRQFQPWLDAPHEELLNSLISEQERIFNITHDPVMSNINNRTIIAVAEVVRQCDMRRAQINKGIMHG